MDLVQILEKLQDIAKKGGYPEVFICGGIPRDKLLEDVENIVDVDLTNGDASIHQIAEEFWKEFVSQGASIQKLRDGHFQVQMNGVKFDFSSNYMVPGIEEMLQKVGVKSPSGLLMEQFSRDFTVNSLLLTTDFKTIKDPTGLGVNDINKERIMTCLPARVTLAVDNKRVVRVLYLAAKLGFDVDQEIIDWVSENPASIKNVKPKYLVQKLQKAIDYDVESTAGLIDEMGLWEYIPILPGLVPYYKRGMNAGV